MNLYILNYNNYYNRIVKFEKSLQDYLQFQVGDAIQSVAFNPNDGVDTIQIVNKPVDGLGNYILCVDDDNVLDSRWFIMESTRLRNGQYKLTLRRDLIVDSYDKIINAPCFIEKATVQENDSAIFNSENMTFNQIKTSETLLKDETDCAWIVGYLATSDSDGKTKTYQASTTKSITADVAYNSIENWEFYKYVNKKYFGEVTNKLYKIYAQNIVVVPGTGSVVPFGYKFETAGDGLGSVDVLANESSYRFKSGYNDANTYLSQINSKINYNISKLDSLAKSYITGGDLAEQTRLLGFNGKIIADASTTPNKYYRVRIVDNGMTNYVLKVQSGSLFNELKNTISGVFSGDPNSSSFELYCKTRLLNVYLDELTELNATINIKETRYHLNDAPYDMFAIPYSDTLKIYKNGTELYTSSKELAFDTAMDLARKYGSDGAKFLYDLQLLPYCPVRYLIQANGQIDVRDDERSISYITQTDGTTILGGIFFARQSSFTFNINKNIEITNKKVQCETEMYRLCSPNYNGVFEFNTAKNGGVNYFNIDCTYRPYNPYIHINPNFKDLYGNDFNDSRGLNVGGDFSLPAVTSAWESYQLQNKNYSQIFDREIQSMTFQNNMQNVQSGIGAIAGTVGGIGAGFALGGPVGAVLGGTVSAVAGGVDYAMQKAQQQEALDYKRDMFGYQLGNIKALPSGLSKTSAFTANNKIFPFLEYYTCTEEEKNALINKIKYNGMTVMRIGTISEFIREEKSYIKGQLIRLEGINEDYHYINEISQEIYKGVFI